MGLVHLHRHGDFSLLDGIGRDEDYARRAAELGQSALALTDHGNLAGSLYHAEACHKVGIKPIVGMEAYFRPSIIKDREEKNTYGYFHLVLLAKNQEGFKNLMRLTNESYTDAYFYQKPNIDWALLRNHSEGLIASSSCVSGYLPTLLLQEDIKGAEKTLRVFQDIFGEDFYLETQPHDFDEQRMVNRELIYMSNKNGIPVVAAVDAHYPFKGWGDTQDVSLMISTNTSVKQRKEDEEAGKNYMKFAGDTFWLMSEDELTESFGKYHPDIPKTTVEQMINNSEYIAEKCEDFNYDKSPKIPKATRSEGDARRILDEWCIDGLNRIGKQEDREYRERLEHELSVIQKLGVSDYFVIVGDMVRWAKAQGIRVGAGRGSAAGSLVNYLIGITALDPIGYDLLFERFLNEYRTELPDIDIDFQDDRRDEVKDYLKSKWGDDHVVDVGAFQAFGHKGVIQDVGRVLNLPYIEIKRATDDIPQPSKLFGLSLKDVANNIPSVARLFKKYPELEKHSLRLFGQMKGQSKHAAAVIVTDQPASELIPMMRSKEEGMVTQWSERGNAQLISPYGFLKIDCLATNGLTNQQKTIKLVKERHGVEIDFEDEKQFPVMTSPYETDEDIIASFADGANIGVFQFESKGIVGLLKNIKPTNLEHVIAANALYRPGTLDNNVAFDYANRKNNRHNWKLPHKSVEQYVGYTYGFMVFQEQVMQIYSALAKDATESEAAIFLKVVAKGIARDLEGKARLEEYYSKFADGCAEKGISKHACDTLWSQILQMSTYSFNKAHSSGYALQGYQDKWLKNRYPIEFYTSLLSIETDKIPEIIRESKFYGISILPPDINTSDEEFTIDGNSIRFGLLGVKYVGPSTIKAIKNARPFESFDELIEKVPRRNMNIRTRNHLLMAGAFDRWGGRTQWILDEDGDRIPAPVDLATMTKWEKEAMGFSVSKGDDLNLYRDIIEERITLDEDFEDGEEALVAGEVINIKETKTKHGDKMAFLTLDYFNKEYKVTMFPEVYKKMQHLAVEGKVVMVLGDWQEERDTVIAEHMCAAESLALELAGRK
jgi:DNA polymerase III subunit alpha